VKTQIAQAAGSAELQENKVELSCLIWQQMYFLTMLAPTSYNKGRDTAQVLLLETVIGC
jgi:hypothetical protein